MLSLLAFYALRVAMQVLNDFFRVTRDKLFVN